MLSRLLGSDTALDRIAAEIYGAIVARARSPVIYADFGVPDTVAGRFEMVVLHMAVAMDRFAAGSERERAIGQRVFDLFCGDMDTTLREFGVGDAVMGKRMKTMAQAFYGRSSAYMSAFASGDRDELASALGRNLFPGEDRPADGQLCDYAMLLQATFAAVAPGGLERGADAVPVIAERSG